MFKGLKSKIAEETKKLQNAVNQVAGEGIAGFSLGKSGDAQTNGSEKSPSRNSVAGDNDTGILVDIPLPNDDSGARSPEYSASQQAFVSANSSMSSFFDLENSPNLLAEGTRTPTRQRHDSAGSIGSLDSNISYLMPSGQGAFSSSANRNLGVITSDIETDNESAAGSTFVSGASKEQISSVLNRLHGRAANYKDKYRQLAKMYNEVIKENDKIRTILTTTQDKALRRIQELREEKRMQEKAKRDLEESLQMKLASKEKMMDTLQQQMRMLKEGKPVDETSMDNQSPETPTELVAHKERVKKLEELLSRCKDSMKAYKERIETLSTENDRLKQKLSNLEHEEGNAAISDFVNDRVAAQNKAKLQETEQEWNRRLTESEERTALTLAQAKQDMHVELEKKDQIIESLREKLRHSEHSGTAEVEELKEQLQRAEAVEKMLEDEKRDLLEQLSSVKSASVKIVQDEENAKRQQLEDEWRLKLDEAQRQYQSKLKKEEEEYQAKIAEKAKEFNDKLREFEEQSQLAIEEREMQKNAVVTKYDERLDQLKAEIEQLKTEKLEFESSAERKIAELTAELQAAIETLNNTSISRSSELDFISSLAQKDDELRLASEENAKLEQRFRMMQEQMTTAMNNHQDQLAAVERELKDQMDSTTRAMMDDYESRSKQLTSEYEERLRTVEITHENTVQQLRHEFDIQISKKEEEWRVQQSDTADEKANQLLAIVDQLRQEKTDLQNDRDHQEIELKSRITQLTDQFNEDRHRYTSEIDRLKAESDRIIQSLAAKDDQLRLASQEVAELQQQLQTAEEQAKMDAEERLKSMESAHEKTVEQLRHEFDVEISKKEEEWRIQQSDTIDEKSNQLLAIIDQLRQEKTELHNDRDRKLVELKSEIAQITEQSEEERDRLTSEIDGLNADKKHLIDDLQAKNEKLSTTLDELERQTSNNAAIQETWIVRLREVNNTMEEYSAQIHELQARVEKERSARKELEQTNKRSAEEHELQLQQLRNDHQAGLERMQGEWNAQQSMELDQRVGRLLAEIEELKKARSDAQAAFDYEIQAANEKSNGLSAIIEQHDSEISRLNRANDELRNSKDQLAMERSNYQQAMEAADNERRQQMQRIQELEELRQKLEQLESQHEEEVESLTRDFQTELARKEDEWLGRTASESDEKTTALMDEIQKLTQEKSALQSRMDQTVPELNSKIAALTEMMDNESNRHSMEIDRSTAENASTAADLLRKDEQLRSAIKELEKQTSRHDQLMKLAQDEWAQKARDYEERIAVLERNAHDELEVNMKTAVAEHNEKVKQLCRDFQLEMSKKENEWQTELNSAYARAEEDRHRAIREYQKEAKQLHQELQEKSKKFNETKAEFERLQKEKEADMEKLKQQTQDELRQLEEQLNSRWKQRLDDFEQKHKQELDGLTTEWTTERRSMPEATTMQSSSVSSWSDVSHIPAHQTGQLEMQAQIAQGDVRQESPMYLKQRVKQLETQIEALKEKQRKELDLFAKGAANSGTDGNAAMDAAGHSRQQRLASISLDNFGPLFAEPTEAEYLKNILFRYMTERESLGKESVTLAKAIAAVLKFSNDQTHIVVAKEEARSSSSW